EPPYRHCFRFRSGAGGEGSWGGGKPRFLGEAEPREDPRPFQTFMGSRFPSEGGSDWSAKVRLEDMDTEGVDAHYLVGGGGGNYRDPELAAELVRGSHRYLDDFCMTDPHRLKAGIHVSPTNIELALEEIHRW